MPPESDPQGFEKLLDLMTAHDVEFIVVGGQAEVILGSSRTTYDVDLCYRRTANNLERLAKALQELKPSLRGAPADLPFIIDAKSLALGSNFTFETPLIPLDLLGWLEPIGSYDDLIKTAEVHDYKGHTLHVIALEDLIHIKEHIARPKDRESLLHLRAIQQSRRKEAEGDN